VVIEARYAKIVMVFGLAAFGLLVAFDNMIDYPANFVFVQHVLSMDTVFPDNTLRWRAITAPSMHHAAYIAIILAEFLTGLCFLACAGKLLANVRAPAAAFHRAKTIGVVGAALGFATWFIGFMVVGGEWFAMWQSPTWNGQQSAFRFYMTLMVVLIFLMQPDGELA
jgi:predicted small integral membrane protein